MMRIIGHRGAPMVAPENTIASFAAAIEAGVDAVELDARLTHDGVLVVMHDDEVARTANAPGRISELTLDEVRALATGGEPVPTLEEVLAFISGRVAVVIEVKAIIRPGTFVSAEPVARAVIPLIEGRDGIVVSSFDPSAVAAVRTLAPAIPTGLSVGHLLPVDDAIALARSVGHVEVHPAREFVTAEVVSSAHAAGLKLCCWTVNDPSEARALAAMGVDAIFTDDPARMIAELR